MAVRAEETGLSVLTCPLKLVQEMRSEPLIVRFDPQRRLLFISAALSFPLLFFSHIHPFTFHFVFSFLFGAPWEQIKGCK